MWALLGSADHASQADARSLTAAQRSQPELQQSAFDRYATTLSTLRSRSVSAGDVTYREILKRIYTTGPSVDDLIAYKTQWQRSAPASLVFLTDYSTVDKATTIEVAKPIRNVRLGSTVVGRYEPRHDCIKIADIANDLTVVHEAGHALQRAALVERRVRRSTSTVFSDIERTLRGVDQQDRIDSRSLKRLRYLTSQDEFEVRLQDLNRFYAIAYAQRPIMTPIDAIQALALLGLKLDPAETANVLKDTAWKRSPEQCATLLAKASADAPDRAKIAKQFEDAYEFVRLQRLVAETAPDLWETVLQKVVFEAPGHL